MLLHINGTPVHNGKFEAISCRKASFLADTPLSISMCMSRNEADLAVSVVSYFKVSVVDQITT